ncbi:hypothetical protein [Streptomyces sp. NPDC055105]|uniref:hypothetical protein n=1 Tax=Streptomyces sp. NPDC055105 TaxID=3365719 RepID=UPI0037CCDC19
MAAGRRTGLATLAGQKVEDVPGKSDPLLMSLNLDQVVPTRFNPRRNFGTDEALFDFGLKLKKEQLAPILVVSRAAYLALWPDEADNVGSAPYVIANGERRYRASLMAGRTTIDVVQKEDVAKSKADFLDAVQSENNDRQDLDPIERALGMDTMVGELGGTLLVAEYYGKTKAWVSQQRKLLKLTPELQQLVSSGVMSPRVGREIAGKPAEEQEAAWQAELKRREEPKPPRSQPNPEPDPVTAEAAPDSPSVPQVVTAVNGSPDTEEQTASESEPTAEAEAPAQVVTTVNGSPAPGERTTPKPATGAEDHAEVVTTVNGTTAATTKPAVVPDPRAHEQQASPAGAGHTGSGIPLRYDEPGYINGLLKTNMTPLDFTLLAGYMLEAVASGQPHLLGQVLEGAFAKVDGGSLKEAVAVVLDAVKDHEH